MIRNKEEQVRADSEKINVLLNAPEIVWHIKNQRMNKP